MSKEVEFYDSGFGEFEKMMKEYAEKVSEGKALDQLLSLQNLNGIVVHRPRKN